MLKFYLTIFCLTIQTAIFSISPDSLKDSLQKMSDRDTLYAGRLNSIAESLLNNEPEVAYDYATKALALSDSLQYERGRATAYLIKGKYYRLKYDYTSALDNFKRAVTLFQHLKDKWAIGLCRYEMAFNFYYMGDFNEALEYFLISRNIGFELSKRKHAVKCQIMMGVIYLLQGNYPKSAEHLQGSLLIAELLYDNEQIAEIYFNLGNLYLKQDNIVLALSYYDMARKKYELTGEEKNLAELFASMGLTYETAGNLDLAFQYYLNALNRGLKESNNPNLPFYYINLGSLLLKQKRYTSAKEYLQKALVISEEAGNKIAEAETLLKLGNLNLLTNDISKALEYSVRANTISGEMNILDIQRASAEQLSQIYSQKSDYKSALNYYKEYKNLSDKIFNDNNIRKSVELEFTYKYEKERQAAAAARQEYEIKEAEQRKRDKIMLYSTVGGLILVSSLFFVALYHYFDKRKTNRELIMQKQEIEEKSEELHMLNATKDKLFSVIINDLKDPFNNIINLSGHLARETAELDPAVLSNFLESINKSANYSYDLLRNLIDWAGSQTNVISSGNRTIALKTLFININGEVERYAKNKEVSITYSHDDIDIFIDINMISTVLRNLIGNAVKYSYRGGEVKVVGQECEDGLRFSVFDNGVGIESERVASVFNIDGKKSTPGTENEGGSGLGLLLCKEFVTRLGGKIYVESEFGKGSTFIFTVPEY